MILKFVSTHKEIKQYLNLTKLIYHDCIYYRDSMTDILKMFLYKKTVFSEHGEFSPFLIADQGKPVLRAAFIIDRNLADCLIIAFFEACEHQGPAVDLMLQKAKELAKARGLKKIICGLDAHLNYGVGFLASHFDVAPCFGLGYTPGYYLDYFRGMREINFTSIQVDVDKFDFAREEGLLKRIKQRDYTFRTADFSHLDREIAIFTSLNNLSYRGQKWWTERTFAEDKELLYPFRWFLSGENLIIAEKDGEPVGLLLWYPDFNQLVAPGQCLGISTLIKLKLGGGRRIDRFKIADIAVHPKFQGTGVILGLFERLQTLVKGRFNYGEGGWIAADNLLSRGFAGRWRDLGCQEYKQYKAFETEL